MFVKQRETERQNIFLYEIVDVLVLSDSIRTILLFHREIE